MHTSEGRCCTSVGTQVKLPVLLTLSVCLSSVAAYRMQMCMPGYMHVVQQSNVLRVKLLMTRRL